MALNIPVETVVKIAAGAAAVGAMILIIRAVILAITGG